MTDSLQFLYHQSYDTLSERVTTAYWVLIFNFWGSMANPNIKCFNIFSFYCMYIYLNVRYISTHERLLTIWLFRSKFPFFFSEVFSRESLQTEYMYHYFRELIILSLVIHHLPQRPISQKCVNLGRKSGRLTNLHQNLDRSQSLFTKERDTGRKPEIVHQPKTILWPCTIATHVCFLVLRLQCILKHWHESQWFQKR